MNHLDLEALVLDSGSHENPGEGMCVMEAVAYFAHEPHSDHPKCASPVLTAFAMAWNDGMNAEDRQRLKPYIPKLVGTAGSKDLDERRAWMATDWLVRVHTPAWLRLAGLNDQAVSLEGLPELVAGTSLPSIKPVLDAVRKDSTAKAEQAWGTPPKYGTKEYAAWDAARDAAWDAARAAAWDAARAAAWDAAWDAARAAARAAAWAAAWAAARDAARAAARDAAWDAARDAARDALRPTVEALQASAFDLFDKMIAVGSEVPA